LGGTVTAVTATGPLASSGGTTPDISIANSTGTGSVVLDQGATISSATITAAVSASITTITGTSANITTVTGTTAGFSSANITQLGSTSATIATLSGTNVTYSSGTVSQLAATSATIASVSGTNVTYSNGNFTSATVTTISGTTATYTSATVTNLAVTSVTISSLSLTNLAAASATITTGNLTFSSTAQRITGDFSNATAANRLLFQTSTTNGNSFVGAMPNGTGTFGAYIAYNGSDPVNSSSLLQGITSTDARLVSTFAGTGSYLPLTFYTGGSERVRIDTSGNVGIGTASPGVKLDLGTDVTAQKLFVFRSSNSKAGFGVQSGDFRSFAPSDAAMTFGQISVSDGTTYTERMRIDSSGNVGIGSASPSEKLQVGGNAYLNVGKYIANRSGAAGVTTASGLELQIDGSTQCGIYTPTSSAMALYTGGSERIRVNSSGNVGIGTASPSTALQVSGTITTTGLTVSNTIVGSINGNAATVTNGLYTTGNQTITARTIQQGSQTATMLTATGSLGGFELQSAGASAAAFMTFHRPGAYASYFGIDTDNQFAVGGWSAGAGLAAMKIGTLGVGTPASGTGGEIRATNNITAYYSDARLKDFKGKIGDALYKVSQLNGYYYTENEKAEEFGFNNKELQVGVSAQEVKAILPEVIAPAPFDMDAENKSKSGEDYMTVRYEKLVPLLIEAIKELKAEVEALKAGK
jgi:hypothetical protein